MIERSLTMSEITPQKSEIIRSAGCRGELPQELLLIIDSLYERFEKVCRPRYCFLESGIEGLNPGGVIMKGLSGAEKYFLFVATAGEEFQKEMLDIEAEGDVVKMFAADLIGSEVAEATVRACREEIESLFPDKGVSNTFSPGYCGWKLTEQKIVFGHFPPNPCGVILNDSCLMYPIKSVSGIVSVGDAVEKREYACAICNRKDCYKNRLK